MNGHSKEKNGRPGIHEAELRELFLEQIKFIPAGERIKRCIQCGTCTGSCPVSYAMDISPRELIALFREGQMDEILRSRTIWICASCYACTTRCPSGIKITDLMYALKRTAMSREYRSRAPQVQILANLFVKNLMSYGRLHEGTLIARYYLRMGVWKMLGLVALGRNMLMKKRIALLPHRIAGHEALSRIIKKAQEIDLRHEPERLPYSAEYVGYRAVGTLDLESAKGAQL